MDRKIQTITSLRLAQPLDLDKNQFPDRLEKFNFFL